MRLCVTSFRLGQVSVDQLAALLDCTERFQPKLSFRGALLQLGEIAFALLLPSQALSQVRSMTRPWHWRRKRTPFSPYLTIVICYGVIQRKKITQQKNTKETSRIICVSVDNYLFTQSILMSSLCMGYVVGRCAAREITLQRNQVHSFDLQDPETMSSQGGKTLSVLNMPRLLRLPRFQKIMYPGVTWRFQSEKNGGC